MKNKLSIVLLSTMLCMLSTPGYSTENINNPVPFEIANLVNRDVIDNQTFNKKLDSAIPYVDSSSGISITHVQGLNNRGSTCWINSTIQLLANQQDFVLQLLQETKQKYPSLIQKKEGVLILELANVMAELLTNKKAYSPESFLNVLAACNPKLYQRGVAGEVKDVLQYLTETIHKLLNNATAPISLEPDQHNRTDVFDKFCQEFQNKYQSIISNGMYAMATDICQCNMCGIATYNTHIYNQLIFPLENVRQMKYKNDQSKLLSYDTSPVEFSDCFTYASRQELSTGDNQIFCNQCNRLTYAIQSTEIEYLPNTLIINLNRGKNKINNVKVHIPKEFNSHKWIRLNNLDGEYYLAAVACHIGESGSGGHWITYARRSDSDASWFEYNDGQVKHVDADYIEKLLNDTQVFVIGNSIDPCTLIYKKVKQTKNTNQYQSNTSNYNTVNTNINQYGYNLNYNNGMYNNMYGMQGTYGYPNMMPYNNMNPYTNTLYNYGYQNNMSYNNMFNFNNNMFMRNNMGMNINNNTMQYNNTSNNNGYNNTFNNTNKNTINNMTPSNNNIIHNNTNVINNNDQEKLLIDDDIESLHNRINQTNQNKRNITQQEGREAFFMVQDLSTNDFSLYDRDPKVYTNTLLDETIRLINNWHYNDNKKVYATFALAWDNLFKHLKKAYNQQELIEKVIILQEKFLPKYNIYV